MAQREADLKITSAPADAAVAVATAPDVSADAPMAGTTELAAPATLPAEDELDISPRERQLILWLTNISHGVNHFQGSMLTPLYPTILASLGFERGAALAAIGVLQAVNQIIMNGAQLGCGFLTPFMQRTRLLGIGYIVMCVGTLLTGLSQSYASLIGARAIMGIGGSPQHPVGASLLSSYFPKRRGAVLALNSTISNIGSMLAPVTAALLVTVVGWRHLMWLVAIPSVFVGLAYLMVKDRRRTAPTAAPKRAVLAKSMASYRSALRNRNMLLIAIVFAVGAAGRGGMDVQVFLTPHLMNDLKYSLVFAGVAVTIVQAGGLIGPLVLGWLSDRFSRRGVLQLSLLFSFVMTQWVARQGAYLPALFLSLILFGAFTSSRNTLTQALIADSVSEEDQDAAFSIYFCLGFLSGPLLAILVGFLMAHYGFRTTFGWTSFTYLVGMVMFFFAEDTPKRREPVASGHA